MKTDIQIAQEAKLANITEIAEYLDIDDKYLEQYGKYKAKIDIKLLTEMEGKKDGKLILVTAINPTPAGEGKTTVSVGLADALTLLGEKTVLALREPSLGPVFGVKGGACGGGYAQVLPMEDINLHFTGDLHAVTAANNLIAAMLDNHIQQGNELNVDIRKIVWKRCIDMNDRQLRNVIDGLGGKVNGVPREDGFDISVASEIMAVLCLSDSISELKSKLSKMIVAYDNEDNPVTAGDIGAVGAATVLLKDALKPNMVQTLVKTPAFIHGGPFANIAHGCNSIMATRMALKLGDYVVTEAGFGADLGAEKFMDIKCRMGGFAPDCVVVVATVRSLKLNGGLSKEELTKEDISALEKGFVNLKRHIDNIRDVFGRNLVVAVNRFPTDTDAELALIKKMCEDISVEAVVAEVFAKGGAGGKDLAKAVIDKTVLKKENLKFTYDLNMGIKEKIEAVARRIYRAENVNFTDKSLSEIDRLERLGYGNLPVCIAKTQYSFSDNPKLLGAPVGFSITVKSIKPSVGAGFIVALTGDIMTMPGLPKKPAAVNIDIDDNGNITGLF